MCIKHLCGLTFLSLFFGCSKIKVENPTKDFAAAEKVVQLKNSNLDEISGIAASIRNPGLFWVHNDSGNKAEVYLIDKNLNIKLTCILDEIENRDWEDIAVGPGPEDGKHYVYIGEIGDNRAVYSYKHIYRFEEPYLNKGTEKITLSSFDTITFKLSGKKKDTETLLIDPISKHLYLVSKREDPVWLYELRFPQSTRDTLIAEKLFSMPFTQIVGGDVSPDGGKILLKNYEHIYYWTNEQYKPVKEILQDRPFEVPYEIEPQGEAIAWDRELTGFYTISEKNVGKKTYLYYYRAISPEKSSNNQK